MTLSAERLALQREAQLAAEQLAVGVTALGRANFAQPGLYSQAFFGLSIGIERTGKLIVIADYAIHNGGNLPTNSHLKKIGHDLRELLDACEELANTLNTARPWISRPMDPIHQEIEATLCEFATKTRYYNLDYIGGSAGLRTDPIARWWNKVATAICERHYTTRQKMKNEARGQFVQAIVGESVKIVHHAENGTEIDDLGSFYARSKATPVVQKYGRLYTLQIVRWLASVISDLSYRGAYGERIESLLGLDEPFSMFCSGDQYLRDHRAWSIYRL